MWEADGIRLWTLVNRKERAVSGDLLKVPAPLGHQYCDLVAGRSANSRHEGREVVLAGTLPPRGIGCFLSALPVALDADFKRFLRHQATMDSRKNFDAAWPRLEPRLRPVAASVPRSSPPPGMVEVPAATLELTIQMRVRECGFYESMPPADLDIGANRYDFRVRTFRRPVAFKRFAMDETPVTNAQFAAFLKASGYRPKHPENFLKLWLGGQPPSGKDDHPVVHVKTCFSVGQGYFSRMSKIEEIEHAVEGLPLSEFAELAVWVDRRRQQLELSPSATDNSRTLVRDHSAFLNSYAPQDEGLYDDAAAR